MLEFVGVKGCVPPRFYAKMPHDDGVRTILRTDQDLLEDAFHALHVHRYCYNGIVLLNNDHFESS
jgi:hypothetical protein